MSAAILRAVQQALREQQLPAEQEKLWSPLPDGPEARVPWGDCTERLELALSLSPDPAIGLRAGERASVATLQVVGHVLLSCHSLREAFESFTRYAGLIIEGAHFTLREEGERASFSIEAPESSPGAQRVFAELALSLAHSVGKLFPDPPRSLPRLFWASFRHAQPDYALRYESVFGCTVRFGADEDALVFPRCMLDMPQAHGDDALRDLLAGRAEALLGREASDASLALKVKTHLRSCDLDCIDAARAARAVGLSQSALRRRLSQEGTTFSALIDDVRRELALSALRDPDVCIKVLSEQLGFSEPCAFHRAFRRWTGTTPARYRDEVRTAACA
jgi:AraC-like DNA-binding protein